MKTVDQQIQDALTAYKRKNASIGGKGRAVALSPRKRKEIARKAARARWAKKGTAA
jgi:hypothetical protein